MAIKILGSSGFIGQNLLKAIPASEGVSLRQDDWRDQIREAGVLINLVGKAHDHTGKASEADFFYANDQLAREVFHAFIESSATLMIHVSSIAAVEEFESSVPLTEEAPCRPVSWYGQSKRSAEEWLIQQALPKGKKLIILRAPMVHGLGDKGNLGLLYKLISRGIPYPLAAFDNRRSFISIDNFCFFIQQIIAKSDRLTSGIYHVADDEPVSTKEIIVIMRDVTGRRGLALAVPRWIVRLGARLGDVLPFVPLNTKRLRKMTSDLLVSNERMKAALGINQLPVSAKDGLIETVKSF